MNVPYNTQDHDVALFVHVLFPEKYFTREQAENAVTVIDDVMRRNSYGQKDSPMEKRDGYYNVAYDCDAYGGIISAPDFDELCDIFSSLSTTYPEALFDVMAEDEDDGKHQYVFAFHYGQCESDSSIVLEPTLNCCQMGQNPTGRTLHFEATDAQMEKVYALLRTEKIQLK